MKMYATGTLTVSGTTVSHTTPDAINGEIRAVHVDRSDLANNATIQITGLATSCVVLGSPSGVDTGTGTAVYSVYPRIQSNNGGTGAAIATDVDRRFPCVAERLQIDIAAGVDADTLEVFVVYDNGEEGQ